VRHTGMLLAGALLALLPACGSPTDTGSQPDLSPELVAAVNAARADHGLAPLTVDPSLTCAAEAHNDYMAAHDCLAHQCPGEAGLAERFGPLRLPVDVGIRERERRVQRGARRDARLDGERQPPRGDLGPYRDIGCAHTYVSGTTYGHYWTCDFGS